MTLPSLTARHWIGGDWVNSENRPGSINPANGEAIGTYLDLMDLSAIRADLVR
jgi:hypothetical protein